MDNINDYESNRGHARGLPFDAESTGRCAVSTVLLITLPVAVLAACLSFALYCLRQLANARMLLYLTDQQWRAVICLLPLLGGATFLILEQAR
jgi:hypothetical protein